MRRIISGLWSALLDLLRNRLAIWRLRHKVARLKSAHYDGVADNLRGMRGIVDTLQRSTDELIVQLKERDARVARLREEYKALQARRAEARQAFVRQERLALLHSLRPVVTQLPTLRAALDDGADLSARDVLDLLAPLDQAMREIGFEPIGVAGAEVGYDAVQHRAVGRGATGVKPGDPVQVRYVGYTHQGEVVCKAQVTVVEHQTAAASDSS